MTQVITPSAGTAPSFLQLGPGASDQYGAIDLRRTLAAIQEGVLDTGGYKVTAGAGMTVSVAASTGDGAVVRGDSIAVQGLYYVPPHTAAIVETITASHATLPRLDKVILEVLDATHDGGASNVARTRVLTGTATSGTTLDNGNDGAHGAPALPASAMLLADVLVPGASASILAANIRDRRPWARGAYRLIVRNSANYTRSLSALAEIDSTNLKPRIECSGVPIRVRLLGTFNNSAGAVATDWALWVDGAAPTPNHARTVSIDNAGYIYDLAKEYEIVPAAGSHTFSIAYGTGSGTLTVNANATTALTMVVEELIRANADNT